MYYNIALQATLCDVMKCVLLLSQLVTVSSINLAINRIA